MAGVYLKEAVTKIESECGGNPVLEYCVSTCQGWRNTQEDSHIVILDFEKDTHLFGVFDGHNGPEVAEYCRRHMAEFIRASKAYQAGDIYNGLKEAFLALDASLLLPEVYEELRKIRHDAYPELIEMVPGITSGTTAIVAIIKSNRFYVAGVGDSRCLLFRKNQAVLLNKDTTPDDPLEQRRIIEAGVKILAGRIDGKINLSRALGDHMFKMFDKVPTNKQPIIGEPLIFVEPHSSNDLFMLLICDGIWNSMDNTTVVQFVNERINQHKPLRHVTEEAIERILPKIMPERGIKGKDNMTIMIIKFNTSKNDPSPSVEAIKQGAIKDSSNTNSSNYRRPSSAVAAIAAALNKRSDKARFSDTRPPGYQIIPPKLVKTAGKSGGKEPTKTNKKRT